MLEFLTGTLKVATIIAAVCMIPTVLRFVRFLFKRLALCVKLRRWCRKNGYSLIPAHFMWLFATKHGKRCDFYIELPDEVYAVKLWNTRGVTEELTFTSDGCVQSCFYTRIPVYIMGLLWFSRDAKKHRVPRYEMTRRDAYRATPILLLHPAPYDVHCPDNPFLHLPGSVGQVNGMHIHSLHSLITPPKESQGKSNKRF